jgi:TPR repeat protein
LLSDLAIASCSQPVGYAYFVGKDYAEADRWWRKAADRVCLLAPDYKAYWAQQDQGLYYFYGHGVAQDYTEAVKWLRNSPHGEFGIADFAVGYCSFYGKGVRQNYAEATRWLLDAINRDLCDDYDDAVYLLCRIYALDEVMKQFRPTEYEIDWKNYTEDVQWVRDDAEGEKAWASKFQLQLGQAYTYGRGVPQDYAEAAKWFHKSADAGNVAAQFYVAVAYDKGRGVPQDYVQAHLWFNLATSGSTGNLQLYASQARDELAREMTSRQIEEAQRLASEWGRRDAGAPIAPR